MSIIPSSRRLAPLILMLLAARPAAAQSLIQEISTGGTPGKVAVNPVSGKAYMINKGGTFVTAVDGVTHVKTTINLGVAGGADDIAVNPAANRIFVTAIGAGNLVLIVIDGATDTVVTNQIINGNTTGSAVAVDPGLNRVFVLDTSLRNVSTYDGPNYGLSTTIAGVGAQPRSLAINPVTHYVYVAGNVTAAGVVVINGQLETVARFLATAQSTWGIAVNPVTNKVYVTSNSTQVFVVNGETAATPATLAPAAIVTGAGSNALAVNPVTNKIYTANTTGHSVTVINGATGATPASAGPTVVLNGTANPNSVTVDPAGNRIFVNDPAGGRVYQLDGTGNSFTWSMSLLKTTGALGVNPVTGRLYAALPNDGQMAVFDERDNAASYGNSTGAGAGATAVNPVTGKAYVANTAGTSVTVVPPTGPNKDVPVGGAPVKIAVNPISGKIYVLVDGGPGGGLVKVISATTDLVTATVPVGAGPLFLTVNPVSNQIYEVSGPNYNYAVIDGSSNTATFVSSPSGAGTPVALAVNPATNQTYVLYNSYVIQWDGLTNNLANLNVAGGGAHSALAINTGSNKIYIAYFDRAYITRFDGNTLNAVNIPISMVGDQLAVNESSNKLYLANSIGATGRLDIVNGATESELTMLSFANLVASFAVNPDSNNIYVAETSGNLSVVDGISDAVKGSISTGIASPALAVNPAAGMVYDAGGTGPGNILALTERPASGVPLTVNFTAFAGNTTGNLPYFTMSAASTYSPTAPPPQWVFVQLDGWQGPWLKANYLFGTWNFTPQFPLTYGIHTVYAWSGDGQEATTDNPASSPAPGQIAAYTFLVFPDGPAITGQPASKSICAQGSASFTVTATGSGILTYGWKHGSTWLTDGGNISGSSTNTLTVNPAGAADAGSYTAYAYNWTGGYRIQDQSNAATLTVDALHTAPSEALDLHIVKGTPDQLTWSPPANTGGYADTYDVLRSPMPDNFTNTLFTTCVASNTSGVSVPDGYGFSAYYLVRAKNACGSTLGVDSTGAPIQGRSCP